MRHTMVPAATPLLGLPSGTAHAQLILHGRVCWNPGGLTSPLQNLPVGSRLQNAFFCSRAVIEWKRPSGVQGRLVRKEAAPPLRDPAEAKSPPQQT